MRLEQIIDEADRPLTCVIVTGAVAVDQGIETEYSTRDTRPAHSLLQKPAHGLTYPGCKNTVAGCRPRRTEVPALG